MKILQFSNISIPFLCLVDALFCILFKQIFKIHFTTNNIFDMRCFYRALNDNQSYLPCRSATVRKQLKTENFYNQIFFKKSNCFAFWWHIIVKKIEVSWGMKHTGESVVEHSPCVREIGVWIPVAINLGLLVSYENKN